MGHYLREVANCDSKLNEPEGSELRGLECNICLDFVQDPVVTFCGHLYCWPCIYRWIITFSENPDDQKPCCPVCKTWISEKTLIPLYSRGQATNPSKNHKCLIPERPSTPVEITNNSSPFHAPSYPNPEQHYVQTGNYTASAPVIDSMMGAFGEMVYARIFGNSEATTLYAYPNSYYYDSSMTPRQQRQMFQMNRSLGRVCFFMCCFTVMCLLLF